MGMEATHIKAKHKRYVSGVVGSRSNACATVARTRGALRGALAACATARAIAATGLMAAGFAVAAFVVAALRTGAAFVYGWHGPASVTVVKRSAATAAMMAIC